MGVGGDGEAGVYGGKMNLYGLKIYQSSFMPPSRPKMQLSPTLPVSDEFRVEFNKWLEDFFGHEIYFLVFDRKTIVTAPENVTAIKVLIDAWAE